MLDDPKEFDERMRSRKSSFSCITKFGIKMTAEDCNLEILRLSEKDPPTSSTLAIPQKRHSRSTVTGGYDSMDVVEVNHIIATPVNLLLATPLRFETEKEETFFETPEEFQEEGSHSEETFYMQEGLLPKENRSFDANDSSYSSRGTELTQMATNTDTSFR